MDAVKWWNPSKLFSDIRSPSGNELGPSSIWKLDKEKAHQSCSTEVCYPRSLATWTSQLCLQVACHVQIIHRCFFFFQTKPTWSKRLQSVDHGSGGGLYFGATSNTTTSQEPPHRLRRMYTQILMFKNTTAAKCLKADFSGCAVWKGKMGVIIMAQTFWACTHGLSDSGKQSAMGSGSCGYQRV